MLSYEEYMPKKEREPDVAVVSLDQEGKRTIVLGDRVHTNQMTNHNYNIHWHGLNYVQIEPKLTKEGKYPDGFWVIAIPINQVRYLKLITGETIE